MYNWCSYRCEHLYCITHIVYLMHESCVYNYMLLVCSHIHITFQLCSCMLHVVMSQNVHKSSTSHVNALMCIYRVANCLKLTDVTFILISMFSKQFSLKVILIKVRTHQWEIKKLLILQLIYTLLAVMVYWLYGTWISDRIVILSVVVCGLLTSQLDIVQGVTCDTVSEYQYISHVYWNRILYMEWHVIQFQNIRISHMYIETEYRTWSDMWYSFRTSVYLTCTLKQDIHTVCILFT